MFAILADPDQIHLTFYMLGVELHAFIAQVMADVRKSGALRHYHGVIALFLVDVKFHLRNVLITAHVVMISRSVSDRVILTTP